jgi:hypothetical protein
MVDFGFLAKYKVASDKEQDIDIGRRWKHLFIPVQPLDLLQAENELGYRLPEEINKFYLEIGYGFFHNNSDKDFNRFLSSDVLVETNLRQDEYEFDPDLDIYNDLNRIIFFQVNEGVFLTIDKYSTTVNSSIYYITNKVANSLKDFLLKYDSDPNYLNSL